MTHELIILEGPQAGRRVPVGGTAMTFGRSPAAAQSFPEDNYMSSLHMTAQSGPGGVVLSDLRSTNGTFVNGERITQVVAGAGAVVKIGSLTLQVVSPEQPKAGPVLSSPMPVGGPRAASVTSTLARTWGRCETAAITAAWASASIATGRAPRAEIRRCRRS